MGFPAPLTPPLFLWELLLVPLSLLKCNIRKDWAGKFCPASPWLPRNDRQEPQPRLSPLTGCVVPSFNQTALTLASFVHFHGLTQDSMKHRHMKSLVQLAANRKQNQSRCVFGKRSRWEGVPGSYHTCSFLHVLGLVVTLVSE